MAFNSAGAMSLGLEVIILIIIAVIILIVLIYLIQSGLLNQLFNLNKIANKTENNTPIP